ncbi:LPP20 family lipoprotein [Parashewanella tropica]|uniref:LPP20 family lipoprotein n=1 Tax=Parashewanella tropica TaxID=2547970 RepID=UPI00105922B3|nr:LPP20 family lipoprotein [Parashewanella tropica]
MSKYLFGIALFLCSHSSWAWPEWVTTNSAKPEYITGVGVGASRAEAENAALAEITAQLLVQVNTNTSQWLEKNNQQTTNQFTQRTQTKTLPFKLVGIESLNSSTKRNQFAVQIGIKKRRLIQVIDSELVNLKHLSVPESHIEQQFVWVVENQGKLARHADLVDIYQMLSGSQSTYRILLAKVTQQFNRVWRNLSCRVVTDSETAQFQTHIERQLPCGGNHEIWIRPNIQWKHATAHGYKHAKASFIIQFMQASDPFLPIKTYQFEVMAKAKSIQKAKGIAIKQLSSQLQQPISLWESAQ